MQPAVEWTAELKLEIDDIDDQHLRLVDMVNAMHRAIREHQGSTVGRQILNELLDYTHVHFESEEALMRDLAYPGYEHHLLEHRQLVEELRVLIRRVDDRGGSIGFELMHFLRMWLARHIASSDRQYAEYFREQGMRPHLAGGVWRG